MPTPLSTWSKMKPKWNQFTYVLSWNHSFCNAVYLSLHFWDLHSTWFVFGPCQHHCNAQEFSQKSTKRRTGTTFKLKTRPTFASPNLGRRWRRGPKSPHRELCHETNGANGESGGGQGGAVLKRAQQWWDFPATLEKCKRRQSVEGGKKTRLANIRFLSIGKHPWRDQCFKMVDSWRWSTSRPVLRANVWFGARMNSGAGISGSHLPKA